MNTQKLLFETDAPDGRRLFDGITDLAREIVRLDRHNYPPKKEPSLVSFLSQIMQAQRACPPNLGQAIESAVKVRLAELSESDIGAWTERVKRAIEMDRLARTSPEALQAELLYYELENIAQDAEKHFIITAQPVEQIVAPRAEILRRILLRRLGLVDLEEPATTKYTFCLPSQEACNDWWVAIFRENKRRAKSGDADASPKQFASKLRLLEKTGNLRLLAIPPSICGVPVVVFNPGGEDPTGFVFFYHTDSGSNPNKVSIAKMSTRGLEDWQKHVYWRLEEKQEKWTRVQVPALNEEAET